MKSFSYRFRYKHSERFIYTLDARNYDGFMEFKMFIIKRYFSLVVAKKENSIIETKKRACVISPFIFFIMFFCFFSLSSLSYGRPDSDGGDDSSESLAPPSKKPRIATISESSSASSSLALTPASNIPDASSSAAAYPRPLSSTTTSSTLDSPTLIPHATATHNEIMDVDEEVDETVEKSNKAQEEIEKDLKSSQLNIYLLKRHEKLPPPKEISEKCREGFEDFPWQFLNESKHCLIGASHDQKCFIDKRVYDGMDGMIEGEKIYLFQESGDCKTEWVTKIHEQADKYKHFERTGNQLFEGDIWRKEPKGAIVFVKKKIEGEERFFAITFGRSGRFLLNLEHCDPTFGKHYAYNILSSNPEYKALAYTEVDIDEKKLKSERAKLSGKVEVLRRVRVFIPRMLTVVDGKKQICSFLGAHIHITNKLALETIGERCQNFLKIANREDYKKEYQEIDYFTPIEDVDKVFIQSFDSGNYDIELPFGIEVTSDTQPNSFKLSSRLAWKKNFSPLEESYNDFSLLVKDLKEFIKKTPSKEVLGKLKKIKISGKDDSSHQIDHWRADQLITATVEAAGKTYWIEGGEVFEVANDFVKSINEKVNESFLARTSLPAGSSLRMLDPFDESVDTEKRTRNKEEYMVVSESAYNKRMQKHHPRDFLLYDCKLFPVTDDSNHHSTVEICDLLSKEGDIIHIKRWESNSGNASYIVTQAQSSTDLLVKDKKFMRDFLETIPKDGVFANVPSLLDQRKFRVILAFIDARDEFTPSLLPFNIKLALYKGLKDITENLGINCKIISIKNNVKTKEEVTKDDKNKQPEKKAFSNIPSLSQNANAPNGSFLEPSLPAIVSLLPASQNPQKGNGDIVDCGENQTDSSSQCIAITKDFLGPSPTQLLKKNNGITLENLILSLKNLDSNKYPVVSKESLEKKLAEQVAKYGFRPVEAGGDGNCFFYSVVSQLELLRKEGKFNENEAIERNHEELRKLAIQHIIDHPFLYSSFIVDSEWSNYIEKMGKNGEWVDGGVIVLALSRALNMNIVVIPSSGELVIFRRSDSGVPTLYLGHQVDYHYQSLVPFGTGPSKHIDITNTDVDDWEPYNDP